MLILPERVKSHVAEVLAALADKDYQRAAALSHNLSDARLAQLVLEFPEAEIAPIMDALGPARAARIFAEFPGVVAAALILEAPDAQAAQWLATMPADTLQYVFSYMEPGDEARVRGLLGDEKRAEFAGWERYPDGSAGALMSPDYTTVSHTGLVADVIQSIRAVPAHMKHTGYVYVVDDKDRLTGVASIRDLLLSDAKSPVEKVMKKDVMAIGVLDSAQEAARRLRTRRFKMIPVVRDDGTLAGVITIEDAIDLISHDIANNLSGIGAASPEESFFTPPKQSIKMRLPWMSANVVLNLAAVSIIAGFEDTIAQAAILAAFLPMITDMGGNVGIQALSVSIRSIALGEARLNDYLQATKKELMVGLVNGLFLGTMFGIIAYVMETNWILGVVAGVALGINVLVAGVVGGTMPFLIKRLGKDPAMMTGPVLTTITDITGVTIYLGLCTIFLTNLIG